MEITTARNASETTSRRLQSSFDCDAHAIDVILGLPSDPERLLRIDAAHPQADALKANAPKHYAPLEVIPAENVVPQCGLPELTLARNRERLLRLLDREQACYDASLQAACAAEQLLQLCEHHQQQWLQAKQNPPVQ